MCVSFLTKL